MIKALGGGIVKAEYESYLRSRHWASVRRAFWDLNDPVCFVCGTEGTPYTINLHHRSYERLGKERWDELVPLCKGCHQRVHDLVDAGADLWDAHLKLKGDESEQARTPCRRINTETQLQADPRGRFFSIGDVPLFDPEKSYTPQQLDQIATVFLYGRKEEGGRYEVHLTKDEWRRILRTEIYSEVGIPDPALTRDRFGNPIDGMYWRTHPNGRPFSPQDIRRTTGSSFYDGVQTTGREIVPPPLPKKREFPICKLEGCPEAAYGLTGLCTRHYSQKRRGKALTLENMNAKLTKVQREEIESSTLQKV